MAAVSKSRTPIRNSARRMAPPAPTPGGKSRRLEWTDEKRRFLLDRLISKQQDGQRVQGVFKRPVFDDIAKEFNETYRAHATEFQMRTQYQALKAIHSGYEMLKQMDNTRLNPDRNELIIDKSQWLELIKKQRYRSLTYHLDDAANLAHVTFPHLEAMTILVPNPLAKGKLTEDGQMSSDSNEDSNSIVPTQGQVQSSQDDVVQANNQQSKSASPSPTPVFDKPQSTPKSRSRRNGPSAKAAGRTQRKSLASELTNAVVPVEPSNADVPENGMAQIPGTLKSLTDSLQNCISQVRLATGSSNHTIPMARPLIEAVLNLDNALISGRERFDFGEHLMQEQKMIFFSGLPPGRRLEWLKFQLEDFRRHNF